MMPMLPEFLARLEFISQEGTLAGLFITASIILLARNWRFLILALLVQYILVGLIMARFVRPDIATLQVLIGAFICPILFLSARQVSVSSPAALLPESLKKSSTGGPAKWWQNTAWTSFLKGYDRRRGPAPTGLVFRAFLALVLILVVTTMSSSFRLPELSPNATTAVYWLILSGLVTLALTEYPMKVGHGLFTALSGFELLYVTLEKSLLLTGLWGAINLLLALAIGYLTVVRGAGLEEGT
jgi:hypothetical protein